MTNKQPPSVHTSTAPTQLEQALRLTKLSRDPEARAAFVRAIDSDEELQARNEFGCYLLRLEQFEESAEQFSILLECAKVLGNTELRAVACNNLAAAYRGMGHTGIAAVFQQQSIASNLCEACDSTNSNLLACDLANRATDAIREGDLILARQLLYRALALEVADGSLEGQAADWGNLGVVALLMGEYHTAIRALWHAYRLHMRLEDDHGAASDLMNLAELFGKLGRWQASIQFLRRAAVQFKRANSCESLERARLMLKEATRIDDVARRNPILN